MHASVAPGTEAGGDLALNMGGCRVDTMSPLPTGTEVELRLKDGKTFRAKAKVAHYGMGVGMGLLVYNRT